MCDVTSLDDGLLNFSREEGESPGGSGNVLKRESHLEIDSTRELVGDGGDTKLNHESPLKLWGESGSPMLRYALGSPSAAFQGTEYFNKLLTDDPLLRSPVLDIPNLLVDADGELVIPPSDGVTMPDSQTQFSGSSASAPPEHCASIPFPPAGASRDGEFVLPRSTVPTPGVESQTNNAGASHTKHEPNRPPPFSYYLPGNQQPRLHKSSGGQASKFSNDSLLGMGSSHLQLHQQRLGNGAFGKGVSLHSFPGNVSSGAVDKSSLSAQAVKGGTQRKRVGAMAAAMAASLAGSCGSDKKNGNGRSRKPKGPLSKTAVTGVGAGMTGSASGRGSASTGAGRGENEYSEEELKRIRRVKNRASVEKCRTKQRMRMEALELELKSLQRENQSMLAVTKCVAGTFEAIRREVRAMTGGNVVPSF